MNNLTNSWRLQTSKFGYNKAAIAGWGKVYSNHTSNRSKTVTCTLTRPLCMAAFFFPRSTGLDRFIHHRRTKSILKQPTDNLQSDTWKSRKQPTKGETSKHTTKPATESSSHTQGTQRLFEGKRATGQRMHARTNCKRQPSVKPSPEERSMQAATRFKLKPRGYIV